MAKKHVPQHSASSFSPKGRTSIHLSNKFEELSTIFRPDEAIKRINMHNVIENYSPLPENINHTVIDFANITIYLK